MEKNNNFDLKTILDNFKNIKIGVVGDLMLDDYIYGSVDRISPEAPVPVVNVLEEKFVLGGAANVVNNLASLGHRLSASVLLEVILMETDLWVLCRQTY